MSAPLVNDAGFRWTESGQDYIHHLGANLGSVSPARVQQVFGWQSADLTAIRRVSIGAGVDDIQATLRFDGDPDSLLEFIAAGRRGAAIEYFPSFANPSESYPCVLMEASDPTPDPDMGWDKRYTASIRLRRTDGGNWLGVTTGSLFYYTAGNALPGLTFTRSGAVGPYVDELGVLQSAAADIFRTDWEGGVPYLLLEAARTNVVGSDDISAWSGVRTPTVTGSQGDPAGGTDAYTVEDSGAGDWEYVYEGVTFTGDATVTAVFVVRENTMPSSGVQRVGVYDQTAGTSRLSLDISGWSGGEPTVVASVGEYLSSREIGGGYWAIFGKSTTVVPANTNRVQIEPAVSTSVAGSIDVYRVNAYSDNVPGVSILDASEARAADTFYSEFPHAPQAMTVYAKFVERGSAGIVNAGVVHIGSSGTGTDPRLNIESAGTGYRARHDNGTTNSTTSALAVPNWGDTVELRMVVAEDGSVLLGQSINAGTETVTAATSATTLSDAWAGARIYLGSRGDGDRGVSHILNAKVLPGVKSLAEMRRA